MLPLQAQDTEDFDVWDSISESMGLITEMEYQADDLSEKELFVQIGVIGGMAAEYRGSDEYEFSYAPNIRIVWKDFLFIKGRKLGVQAFNGEHFYAGAFVRYTGGRSENNDGLEGLGDISRTFTSGAYLNYRYEGIRLKTEVRHDFFNEGHGSLAIASLGSRIPWNKPLFYVGVETTWASKEHMNTFFGISRFQSLQSGLSEYSADSGMRDVSLNISSGYKFAEHWSVTGQVSYRRLLGDAADSPIVGDVGSKNNFIIGLGLNYIF
jgi:outer membrane scaffolding protein for murein synthesis (MipA/OmpV family)